MTQFILFLVSIPLAFPIIVGALPVKTRSAAGAAPQARLGARAVPGSSGPLARVQPARLLDILAMEAERLDGKNRALWKDNPAAAYELGRKFDSQTERAGSVEAGENTPEFGWSRATARGETSRNQMAVGISMALRRGWLGKLNLDWGRGRYSRHARAMARAGVETDGIDTFIESLEHNRAVLEKGLKRKYDSATITNVLTSIEEPLDRLALLIAASRLVKEDGNVIVSVYRLDRPLEKKWRHAKAYRDGALHPGQTFFANIQKHDLELMLSPVFERLAFYTQGHPLVAVASHPKPLSSAVLRGAFLRQFRQFDRAGNLIGHILAPPDDEKTPLLGIVQSLLFDFRDIPLGTGDEMSVEEEEFLRQDVDSQLDTVLNGLRGRLADLGEFSSEPARLELDILRHIQDRLGDITAIVPTLDLEYMRIHVETAESFLAEVQHIIENSADLREVKRSLEQNERERRARVRAVLRKQRL